MQEKVNAGHVPGDAQPLHITFSTHATLGQGNNNLGERSSSLIFFPCRCKGQSVIFSTGVQSWQNSQ